LLLNGTKIYSANSGDSRAIVVGKNGRVKQLSRDHKPCDPDEAERIKAKGGRIEAFRDMMTGEEMGPQRVWL
jgi:serine/threonine protein phosphatase PrpC